MRASRTRTHPLYPRCDRTVNGGAGDQRGRNSSAVVTARPPSISIPCASRGRFTAARRTRATSSAAVEVERVDRAEGDEGLGELLEREPGVLVAPAVRGDRDQPALVRSRAPGHRPAARTRTSVRAPS